MSRAHPPVTRSDAVADPLLEELPIDVDPTALGSTSRSGVRAATGQLIRVARAALAGRRSTSICPPIRAVRLQGRERISDRRLSLLYIGTGAALEYVRDLVLVSPTTTVLEQRRSPLAVRALLRKHRTGADIVVVDAILAVERLLVPRAFHRVPRWVKQTLAVGGSAEAVRARVGTGTLRWARRMFRRHGYRVDLAVTDDARLHFFRELYEPFVRARFGREAVVVDERRFRREARSAGVLRLWARDEIVAGSLVRAAGDELQIVWFGAKPAARECGLKGVSDVLDCAALCLARRGGFERLHFGSSRASLADGVLQYKQKWGATIQPGRLPRADLRLAIDPASPPARAFLERARLIVRTRSGLWELLADDPATPPRGSEPAARPAARRPMLRRLDGLAAGKRRDTYAAVEFG